MTKGLVSFLGAFLCLALGCGGGGGSQGDAARDGDAGEDVAEADGGDAVGDVLAPPMAGPGSRLVIAGDVTLVGSGQDSCTNAPEAKGDRWCAFARPAGEYSELWVIDVTKAAGGAAIACDGSDASCLRLSSRLYRNRMTGFVDSGFNGDTLIYGEYPFAGSATSSFGGVISAWRPGRAEGQALTSDRGIYCLGQARSDALLCFENRIGDGITENVTVDMLAGHLGSVTGKGGLPKIDTLLLAATTDAPGAPPRCQFDLSFDGRWIAWSTRTATDPVETLRAYILNGKSEAIVAAKDVTLWAISPDGGAWYWLSGYNYDVAGAPSGTLQTSTFPTGLVETLATDVGDYGPVGAKSLWLRTGVTNQVGTLRWMLDREAPATITTVDTHVLAVLDHARDGARFLYAKSFASVRPTAFGTGQALTLVDLYAGAPGAAAPCAVLEPQEALHATLSAAGDLVAWDRYDTLTGETRGFSTSVGSCASAPFAEDLANLLPAGDAGFLYLDDADENAKEATLRYAGVVNGTLVPATPPIQTRAAPVFAPLQPALAAVAYTVHAGTSADGLYLAEVPRK
jgi:hypothetical protein